MGICLPGGGGDQPILRVESIDLLGRYAWYQANGQERAWPCGSLLPNDLGLFDMLGNVFEWCQDRALHVQAGRNGNDK